MFEFKTLVRKSQSHRTALVNSHVAPEDGRWVNVADDMSQSHRIALVNPNRQDFAGFQYIEGSSLPSQSHHTALVNSDRT